MTVRSVGTTEDLSEADVSVSVVVERVELPVELGSRTVVVSVSGVVELIPSVPVLSFLSVVTGPVVSQSAEEEPEEAVVSSKEVELAVVEVSVTVTVESSLGDVSKEVDPVVEGSEELTRASEVVEEVEESWLEEKNTEELVSLVVLVLTVTVLVSVAVEDASNPMVLGEDEEDSVEVRSVVDVSTAPEDGEDDELVVEGTVEDMEVDV